MQKSLKVSRISFGLAAACWIAYQMSPNYIAEDGVLVESFGYIPLARFFAFVSVIAFVFFLISRIRSAK